MPLGIVSLPLERFLVSPPDDHAAALKLAQQVAEKTARGEVLSADATPVDEALAELRGPKP